MAASVRVTITVPAGLRERMDKFRGEANWSKIASDAIEDFLDRHNKKGKRIMKEVAERLKKTQEPANDKAMEMGRKWAAEEATLPQLRRLARADDPIYGWMFYEDGDAFGPAERFYFIIEPDNRGDRTAAEEFWDSTVDETIDYAEIDGDLIHHFALGAMEVYEEASREL